MKKKESFSFPTVRLYPYLFFVYLWDREEVVGVGGSLHLSSLLMSLMALNLNNLAPLLLDHFG